MNSKKPPVGFVTGKITLTRLPNKGRLVQHVLRMPGNESRILRGKGKDLQILKDCEGATLFVVFFRKQEGKKNLLQVKAIYYDDPHYEDALYTESLDGKGNHPRGMFLEAVFTLSSILSTRMPTRGEFTSNEFIPPRYLR